MAKAVGVCVCPRARLRPRPAGTARRGRRQTVCVRRGLPAGQSRQLAQMARARIVRRLVAAAGVAVAASPTAWLSLLGGALAHGDEDASQAALRCLSLARADTSGGRAAVACIVPVPSDTDADVVDLYAAFDAEALGATISVNKLELTAVSESGELCGGGAAAGFFSDRTKSGESSQNGDGPDSQCDPVAGAGVLGGLVPKQLLQRPVSDADIVTWFVWEDKAVAVNATQLATSSSSTARAGDSDAGGAGAVHLASFRAAASTVCSFYDLFFVSFDLVSPDTDASANGTQQETETTLGGDGGPPVVVDMDEFFARRYREGGACESYDAAREAAGVGSADVLDGPGFAGYAVPLGGFFFVVALAAALRTMLSGGSQLANRGGFRRLGAQAAAPQGAV